MQTLFNLSLKLITEFLRIDLTDVKNEFKPIYGNINKLKVIIGYYLKGVYCLIS